jgi:hypothetical protein
MCGTHHALCSFAHDSQLGRFVLLFCMLIRDIYMSLFFEMLIDVKSTDADSELLQRATVAQ